MGTGRFAAAGAPDAKLADVLNLDAAEVVAAAGRTAAADPTGGLPTTRAPRRPLTPMLPFQLLAPEEFERVVADLMERRYPGAKVSQLGGQGDDQRGFDVLIVQPDGHRIGVQCKREQQFGPKKVEAAVEAAELEVDESFIALARVATAGARFELAKHAGWQMWDAADLSRLIRLLDLEAAVIRSSALTFPTTLRPSWASSLPVRGERPRSTTAARPTPSLITGRSLSAGPSCSGRRCRVGH